MELIDIRTLASRHRVLLFDLWGVILEGEVTYQNVVEIINDLMLSNKVYFVTNAPRPNYKVIETLKSRGLSISSPEQIISSGDVARRIILDAKISVDNLKICHLGAERNADILDQIPHTPHGSPEGADVLLLTLYRDEGDDLNEFDDLLLVTSRLDKKPLVICANPDEIIPNNGKNRYCAGFFAKKYEKFGGKVIYTGKPYKEIFNEAMKREASLNAGDFVMIGDTIDTDIQGAGQVGMPSAMVFTGNAYKYHSGAHEIEEKVLSIKSSIKDREFQPDYLLTWG
jgi:HAD superfamily hydrolase (TIGR01459 family)